MADEELQPTNMDGLVDLPDESIVEIEVDPQQQKAVDAKKSNAAQVAPEAPSSQAPAGDADTESAIAVLRKEMEEKEKAHAQRLRDADARAVAAQQARDQAERSFREQQQATQDELAATHLASVQSGIDQATATIEGLEGEIARLYEAGEFGKVAAAQSKLAKASAALDRLETQKAELEAGRGRPAPHEGAVTPPPGNQIEQFYSQFAPVARQWLQDHPECLPPNLGGNAQANAKMMAGHYSALAKGIIGNTPEYFEEIELHTGHRKAETPPKGETPPSGDATQGKTPAKAAAPPVRKAAPSAPPSRTEGPATGESSNIPRTTRQVRLTKAQQEHAILSFPHLGHKEAMAEYAKNLVQLESEGKMGRTTH